MSSLMEPNFALESRKPYNEKYTRAPGGSIENYSILCANVGFINDNSPGTFSFIMKTVRCLIFYNENSQVPSLL